MIKPVLLFDVNGTLLDLSALDRPFERLFGRVSARQEWFGLVQTLWMTDLITNQYHPFSQLAETALRMLVGRYGTQRPTAEESLLTKVTHAAADTLGLYTPTQDEAAILDGLKALPVFADVLPGLQALRGAGFRLAALTNGAKASAETMLRQASVLDYFESVLSVEEIERYKPAPEAYAFAARQLQVSPSQICLVAAHAWDLAGATAAGCQTAFLQRPGEVLNPRAPAPNWSATNLTDLARQLT